MSVWVIAHEITFPNRTQGTVYWCPNTGLVGDIWRPINDAYRGGDFGVIATWPTKREATAAHRTVFGHSSSRIEYRVVKLSDADAAIITNGNAAPVKAKPGEPESAVPAKRKVDPLNDLPEVIDSELRREARTVAWSMVRFRQLIARAKAKRIHEALGFKSWTAYVADVIGIEMTKLPVDDRRQIVALLAGEGMSQRAIAPSSG